MKSYQSLFLVAVLGGLSAQPALAGGLPGPATDPGDVSITSIAGSASYSLVCGNGGTVDFGTIAAGQSVKVTSGALSSCNKQAIWVQTGSQALCKWLTDYRTDYAPINFNVTPSTGVCATGQAPGPSPDPGPTPTPSGKYILGGWVGDDGWDTPLPASVGQLDVLNLGYITCIKTLRNGRCESPGMRNANDGPPAALAKAAKVVTYVLGGDGCNASGWNVDAVVNAGNGRWGGVDIDKECPMDQGTINATVNALNEKGKVSTITYLTDVDKTWLGQVQPVPTYYAAMAFWGSEFCARSNPAPGCVRGPGGLAYEDFIPRMLADSIKAVGTQNASRIILGLHAVGTNEATVDFWCGQVKANGLGGIFVSFIEKMPVALTNRLRACLAN